MNRVIVGDDDAAVPIRKCLPGTPVVMVGHEYGEAMVVTDSRTASFGTIPTGDHVGAVRLSDGNHRHFPPDTLVVKVAALRLEMI